MEVEAETCPSLRLAKSLNGLNAQVRLRQPLRIPAVTTIGSSQLCWSETVSQRRCSARHMQSAPAAAKLWPAQLLQPRRPLLGHRARIHHLHAMARMKLVDAVVVVGVEPAVMMKEQPGVLQSSPADHVAAAAETGRPGVRDARDRPRASGGEGCPQVLRVLRPQVLRGQRN